MKHRILTLMVASALLLACSLPASAFFFDREAEESPTAISADNGAPVARDLELTTYQNVAITERFDGVDPEGDLLTYHVVKKPARGGGDGGGGRQLCLHPL